MKSLLSVSKSSMAWGVMAFLLVIAPAMASFDVALEESSRVSGASAWKTLFRITLPVLRPAILAAFILGLVPLVVASGAGAATQRAVGTAVFGGMIAASFLGIFVIPGLYVAFQTGREKIKGMLGQKPPPPAKPAEPTH